MKKVVALLPNGGFKFFDSAKEANDFYGLSKGCVAQACKGKSNFKIRNNYWSYYETAIEKEVFKKHPDYDIECSNFGRIKLATGTITKGYFSDGYRNIKIGKKSMKVHRLVCDTFKPYPIKIINPQHTQINHIDYNRGNNRIENLEWCTPKENIEHANKRKRT